MRLVGISKSMDYENQLLSWVDHFECAGIFRINQTSLGLGQGVQVELGFDAWGPWPPAKTSSKIHRTILFIEADAVIVAFFSREAEMSFQNLGSSFHVGDVF